MVLVSLPPPPSLSLYRQFTTTAALGLKIFIQENNVRYKYT